MKEQINISQNGSDGFGHQLHGLLTVIAMDGIRNYKFDSSAYLIRFFRFAHLDFYEKVVVWRYLFKSVVTYTKSYGEFYTRMLRRCHIHEIDDIPKNHNKNITYTLDNVFYPDRILNQNEMKNFYNNLLLLKRVLVNSYLPSPNLRSPYIALYFRQGDALLYEERKIQILKFKEKLSVALPILRAEYDDYELIVHSDGPVDWIRDMWAGEIKIKNRKQRVLQVLSDLINAEILMTAPSSLSSAAAWLSSASKIITEDELLLNANINGCYSMDNYINK